MSLRSSILKVGLETGNTSFRRNLLEATLRNADGAVPNKQFIDDALRQAGVISPTQYKTFMADITDEQLEKTLQNMAKNDPQGFKKIIQNMQSNDAKGLRTLYSQSDDVVQKQMVDSLDGGASFFKIGELTPAQKRAQTKAIAAPQFAKADGGRAWFGTVWDSLTFNNLQSVAVLSTVVGGAWIVMSLYSTLTGKDMLEVFSDFFEFIQDPASALLDGEEGNWSLTGTGKVFFSLVGILGVAAAVKLVKSFKGE